MLSELQIALECACGVSHSLIIVVYNTSVGGYNECRGTQVKCPFQTQKVNSDSVLLNVCFEHRTRDK